MISIDRTCVVRFMCTASLALAALAGAVAAQAAEPIKIGVIAESQSVAGSSIAPAAKLAADEINAKGGLLGGRMLELLQRASKNLAA